MAKILEERGPYKITGTRVAYQNPWIRIVEEAVIHPNGSPGLFGIIEIGEGRGGISVLPLDHDENVYLVREFMFAIGKFDIEILGGGVDPGESDLEAARRELYEELGIEAEEWLDLGRVAHATTLMRAGAKLFLARGFDQHKIIAEKGIEVVRLPLIHAVRMVMDGEITASTTCCALLKAARILNI